MGDAKFATTEHTPENIRAEVDEEEAKRRNGAHAPFSEAIGQSSEGLNGGGLDYPQPIDSFGRHLSSVRLTASETEALHHTITFPLEFVWVQKRKIQS